MSDIIPKVLCIVGPTASGKTALSVELALRLGGEIVSADSMQIYRGMDVGTAKPTLAERRGVPHHMLDVVDVADDFSVFDYVTLATGTIDGIISRGALPVIVGGTGLYVDALVGGMSFPGRPPDDKYRRLLARYASIFGPQALHSRLAAADPESAAKLHPNDVKRVSRALEVLRETGCPISRNGAEQQQPRYNPLYIGLNCASRELLYERINRRVDAMIDGGLLDEARRLLATAPFGATSMQAIGYKEAAEALQTGDTEAAAEKIKAATRHYAKRQLTWLRRNPNIHWLVGTDNDAVDRAAELARRHFSGI